MSFCPPEAVETLKHHSSSNITDMISYETNKVFKKPDASKYFITSDQRPCPIEPMLLHYRPLITGTPWTNAEKEKLKKLVLEQQEKNQNSINWTEIANGMRTSSKTARECMMKYRNSIDPSINHSVWSAEEERKLLETVIKHDEHNWCSIADELGTNRTPLQCLKYYQLRLNASISKKSDWTDEEDAVLEQAVKLYGENNWQHVANCLPGRASTQCAMRWRTEQRGAVKLGPWSEDEERRLILAVLAYGEQKLSPRCSSQNADEEVRHHTNSESSSNAGHDDTNDDTQKSQMRFLWKKIAPLVPGRDPVQCREKWMNVLDPFIDRGPFRPEEDEVIIRETAGLDFAPGDEFGSSLSGFKWARLAKMLPGRTDNKIWVRWKELNGRKKSSLYRERARKRKTITPSMHARRTKIGKARVDVRDYEMVLTAPLLTHENEKNQNSVETSEMMNVPSDTEHHHDSVVDSEVMIDERDAVEQHHDET
mmetsp:Transcript_21099/g.30494  ORF Transcript_21099/g.30494 Transcript_21099/m.30494 type:complete len:481 (+) Transcript_21099:131-1573(+)|eukprot:CAMPEP_0185041602 /NCGR_PEP_ID=MMETSP1103-20130426/41140_1 /TAXON_ID=36769 /ORGANISM="Paraphysomonas bandaiensis, Strain Caron Lab Isolate" /LENGTH=480 /DNA_ID=CAMNT_0027581421 /DNA_START=63 /DNA_END=1505 /DNA_ORIENTATION=+